MKITQKSAALNCKKSASRFFIHKGGSLFTASLLSALLFAQCANVKGIFTDSDSSAAPDDTTPAKESDPRCANAPQSSGFNDGDGMTEDSPFLICAYAQLGMMGDDLSAHYELGDNIDASASCGGDCGSPSGSGWTPVGDAGNNFSGALDGKGYVVSNLFVNISGSSVGFFGVAGAGAKIRNIGLSNVDVRAGNGVGGLVGHNSGTISNSYVTGSVSSASGVRVGGLVGHSSGTISNSYAAATVTGNGNIGGLVGNAGNGTISNSYATGTVTGSSNVGGLVGTDGGTISNSYATGTVTGSSNVGGLVGNAGTVSNGSYWDTETGLADGCGTGTCPSGGGLTTAQMQAVSGTYPSGLGDGFQFTAGSYPKVKKCTVCTGTLEFSDELVPGQ